MPSFLFGPSLSFIFVVVCLVPAGGRSCNSSKKKKLIVIYKKDVKPLLLLATVNLLQCTTYVTHPSSLHGVSLLATTKSDDSKISQGKRWRDGRLSCKDGKALTSALRAYTV